LSNLPACTVRIIKQGIEDVMVYQKQLTVTTNGRGTYDITRDISGIVSESSLQDGLCHIFVHHTSASLILCENADPTVRRDLETFMKRLVPDGDAMFQHIDEGPDDMPAHVRTVLTQSGLSIPVINGRCSLGTWQGVFLWEHRTMAHNRRITVTLSGD
jgi:secondary thiamine-phosphate synthase enzyme